MQDQKDQIVKWEESDDFECEREDKEAISSKGEEEDDEGEGTPDL